MDERLKIHNLHRESPETFLTQDPQLRRLEAMKLVFQSSLLESFPADTPGIYTLAGGRQVGKSTLLKQWMYRLICDHCVTPDQIAYITADLIHDNHALERQIQSVLDEASGEGLFYLLIDEVTFIEDWARAIKFLADAGRLENVWLLLTGSDTILLQSALKQLPGRRGSASQVDFHYYPLSFREAVALYDQLPSAWVSHVCSLSLSDVTEELLAPYSDLLYETFRTYHITGGYLTAINDYALTATISDATLRTYADRIRGDILKHNKSEHYLKEVLGGVLKRYTSQITWNNLSKELSIDHPNTVADYCKTLESMDAIFIQSAIQEDKLLPAPKKAKKVFFSDPFIHHAIAFYVEGRKRVLDELLHGEAQDDLLSPLVEASMVTHIRRRYPTYYIKSKGEVDVAYVDQGRFWPIEVKWSDRVRTNDLKQLRKYDNAVVGTRRPRPGSIEGVPAVPLPILLLRYS